MKKIVTSAALLVAMSSALLAATETLATVNGSPITIDDANNYVAQTQPNAQYDALPADQKKMIVDRLIERVLFIEQAKKEGIEQDPEYQRLLARDKEELMVRTWITKQFENTVISDSEAKAYYDKHPDEFKIPGQVHARHILLEKEQDAKDVIAQLHGLKEDA